MKLSFTILTTAALALAAPSAEVTRDLPARFAIKTLTAEPRASGARVRVQNNGSNVCFNITGDLWPASDGIFLGGRGRMALDLSVHTNPLGTTPPSSSPPSLGDWNLGFLPGMATLQIMNEEHQVWLESLGSQWHPTVEKWVQDASGTLRLVDAQGVLLPNGFRLCGSVLGAYVARWDVVVKNCPEVQLKVVPL